MRRNSKDALGDFQTPLSLALQVCRLLKRMGVKPASIVEPTCGAGAFVEASSQIFDRCETLRAFDIDAEYVNQARSRTARALVKRRDFFAHDWPRLFASLPSPALVLGNPPWVTSSEMTAIGGDNLPDKENVRGLRGIEAMTGQGNFDISESMIGRLLDALAGQDAVLAMLCKTSVARRILADRWERGFSSGRASFFSVDARAAFSVAVDAGLLVCRLDRQAREKSCDIFPSLDAKAPESTFAYVSGRLVSNVQAYSEAADCIGKFSRRWRSGIKHDCMAVMELSPTRKAGVYRNGLDERVALESELLWPTLKGSELALPPRRYMLVTQRTPASDTARIEDKAPLAWRYLNAHAARLDSRASAIYRHRPRFAVFGVGDYSFAPWKVVVSAFSSEPGFHVVGPHEGRPVVVGDTCYFLPCRTKREAAGVAALLRSRMAQRFFSAFIFPDAKRPVTAGLLNSLDLERLARPGAAQEGSVKKPACVY